MYAIVDIAGQQFRVEKGQEIYVHRLEGKEGSKVDFDRVLFINNQGKTVFGTPVVEGAGITCQILEHTKADKVLVFKKKNRKGYQKLNGHRQYMSLIRVEEIIETGMKPVKKTEEAKPKAKAPRAEKVKEPAATTKAAEAKTATIEVKEKKEEKPPVKKATATKAPAKAKKEIQAAKPAKAKETKKAAPKKAAAPKAKKESGKSGSDAKKNEKKDKKDSGSKE